MAVISELEINTGISYTPNEIEIPREIQVGDTNYYYGTNSTASGKNLLDLKKFISLQNNSSYYKLDEYSRLVQVLKDLRDDNSLPTAIILDAGTYTYSNINITNFKVYNKTASTVLTEIFTLTERSEIAIKFWEEPNTVLGVPMIEKGTIASKLELYSGDDVKVRSCEQSIPENIKQIYIEGNSRQILLPDEYQEIEYLQNSGTQRIDTGLIPTNSTSVDITYQALQVNGVSQYIVGSRLNASTTVEYAINGSSSNAYWDVRFNGAVSSVTSMTRTTDKYHSVVELNNGNGSWTLTNLATGATNEMTLSGAVVNATANLFLFAYNKEVSNTHISLRIFETIIKEADIVVRHYIPCYRKFDKVAGLYDIINNTFQENDGTGEFIISADYESRPTPELPIEIQSVGDKTINLLNPKAQLVDIKAYLGIDLTNIDKKYGLLIKLKDGKTVPTGTFFGLACYVTETSSATASWIVSNGALVKAFGDGQTYAFLSFNPSGNWLAGLACYPKTQDAWDSLMDAFEILWVEGSYTLDTMPEYEPYGYKIPINVYKENIVYLNSSRGLPNEYQELDYIQSTDVQYIDTGFTPNQDTKVYCKFQLTSVGANYPFGVRETSTTNICYVSGGSSVWNFRFGSTAKLTYGQTDTALHEIEMSSSAILFDNEQLETPVQGDFTCPGNLYLFAINNNGSVLEGDSKIFAFMMWDGSNLIRDYIPCYRKSDNKPGMYDLVNSKFYTNLGTSDDFIKGNIECDILENKVIDSSGSIQNSTLYNTLYIQVNSGEQYRFIDFKESNNSLIDGYLYDENKSLVKSFSENIITIPEGVRYIGRSFSKEINPKLYLIRSKNLFDISKTENGTIGSETGQNLGTDQYPNRCRSPFIYLTAGNYTISFKDLISTGSYIHRYTSNDSNTWLGRINLTRNGNVSKFTLDSDCYIRFTIQPINTSSDLVLNTETLKQYQPQLLKSITATDYESYFEPQGTIIYINEPLRKVGEYIDYIDYKNKKVIRNTKKLRLTSSIGWTSAVSSAYYYNYCTISDIKQGVEDKMFLCNTYQIEAKNSHHTDNRICYRLNFNGFLITDDDYRDSTAFGEMLDTNNVVVVYPINTTEETIEVKELKAYNNSTNIVIDLEKLNPTNTSIDYWRYII